MLPRKVLSLMMVLMLAITLIPAGVMAYDSLDATDGEPTVNDTTDTETTPPAANPEESREESRENSNEIADEKKVETQPENKMDALESKPSTPATQPTEGTLDITHQRIADNGSLVFHASLPNAEKASGKWTFVFDGRKIVRTNDQTTARAKYFSLPDGYEAGKEYEVTVRYEGVVDGEPVVAEETYKFKLTLLEWGAVCTEKGIEFNAELAGAEKVRGNWTFILFSDDAEVIDETGKVSGSAQHHTVTKEELGKKGFSPGIYEVHVDFQGRADGAKTHLFGIDSMHIGDGAPCLPPSDTPGDGDNGNGGDDENEDPGQTPDNGDKDQPDPKDDTDGKVENGRSLPGTSSNTLTFMLIGAGIALAGLILFLFRKRLHP